MQNSQRGLESLTMPFFRMCTQGVDLIHKHTHTYTNTYLYITSQRNTLSHKEKDTFEAL